MKILGETFAGLATAATRVIEVYTPEDKILFEDPFALTLLPFGWRVFFRLIYLPGLRSVILSLRERRMPGSLGSILCRTRYIDDVLRRSLQMGLDQVVILGAGFDSRTYRISGMNQVRVFEIDLPGTRDFKKRRLEKIGSPMIFGLDPGEQEHYLSEQGLELVEQVGDADYQELYLKPLGRKLNVFDGERAAYAVVRQSLAV